MPFTPPVAEQRLVLDTIVGLADLAASDRFAAADGDTVEAVLEGVGQFAAGEWAPLARIGDTVGAQWTADGVVMLGAYEWAFVKPIRKLYYNITITLISAIVAIAIGGIETLALLASKLGLSGGVWDVASALGENFNGLGFAIIALFVACWVLSFAIYRWKRFDEIEVVRG